MGVLICLSSCMGCRHLQMSIYRCETGICFERWTNDKIYLGSMKHQEWRIHFIKISNRAFVFKCCCDIYWSILLKYWCLGVPCQLCDRKGFPDLSWVDVVAPELRSGPRNVLLRRCSSLGTSVRTLHWECNASCPWTLTGVAFWGLRHHCHI